MISRAVSFIVLISIFIDVCPAIKIDDIRILNSLSISQYKENYLQCNMNSIYQNKNWLPQMKVLDESQDNTTTVRGRFVKVHKTGRLIVLCYIKTDDKKNDAIVWITKPYEITKSTEREENGSINMKLAKFTSNLEVKEILSETERDPFMTSMDPQINTTIIQNVNNNHVTVSCSHIYSLNERRDLQLLRILSNGTKLSIRLNSMKLSASFVDENLMMMKYNHDFIYDDPDYFKNSFECRSVDKFASTYKSKFIKHIDRYIKRNACAEIKQNNPSSSSGIFLIHPRGLLTQLKFNVYCEYSNDEAWIVIQRRIDGSVSFNRTWIEYKNGFGDLNEEFWLGNDKLHELTSAAPMKIRFDLWDKDDNHAYAEYSTFNVANESDNYRLSISGYSGNAGDSEFGMADNNNMEFSTLDGDNDRWSLGSCSLKYGGEGGWWYNYCRNVNLNGRYSIPGTILHNGIMWYGFRGNRSLKKTIMKISYK